MNKEIKYITSNIELDVEDINGKCIKININVDNLSHGGEEIESGKKFITTIDGTKYYIDFTQYSKEINRVFSERLHEIR